jgi:O-Antigen ligase
LSTSVRLVPPAGSVAAAASQPVSVLPLTPWLTLAALGVALTTAIAAISGDTTLGLATAILVLFAVLPLRAPLETAFLLLATSWLPIESLLGEERNLFAFAGGVNVSGVRLVAGVAGLVIAVTVCRERLRRTTIPRGLAVGLTLYAAAVAWMALSTAWAPSTVDGLRAVAKLILPVLIGAVVLSDPRAWGPSTLTRRTLLLLAWTLTAAALYGVGGFFARDALLPTDAPFGAGRYFGWAGWSSYAFLAGILGITFLALAEHRSMRGAWPYALAALTQVVMTVVRIAIGAAAVAVFVMTAVAGARRVLAPVAVAACAILALLFPPFVERNLYEDRGFVGNIAQLTERPLDVVNTQGREDIWSGALGSMAGTEFIRGKGLNAYFTETGGGTPLPTGVSSTDLQALQVDVEGSSTVRSMHNDYVRFLYETGAVGLALFLAAWALVLASLVGLATRAPRHTRPRALGEGALGSVVFYLATGITDNSFDLYLVGGVVWTVVALAVVSGRTAEPQGAEEL